MNKNPKVVIKYLNHLYKTISHPYSFLYALLILLFWFIAGSFMHYDEHWHDAFILFEAIITLLMVFIIESTQQADNRAIQEKLDEIIEKLPQTDNRKIGIEKKYKGER